MPVMAGRRAAIQYLGNKGKLRAVSFVTVLKHPVTPLNKGKIQLNTKGHTVRKPQPDSVLAQRNYLPASALPTSLPFISSPRYYQKQGDPRCGTLWRVPRTGDYEHARTVGQRYAAHFAQYLKDNPASVGHNLLGRIATDIDFHDASAKRGYWIGFFSFLEQLIYAQATQQSAFDVLKSFQTEMTAQRNWPASHLK